MIKHKKYILQTFELALKGLGHTSPNPMVGAVLVRDDLVLGVGFHQKYGSAKAEMNAILDAKANGFEIAGSTLYCNLEPSICVATIIEEKISKVVVSTLDPKTKVLTFIIFVKNTIVLWLDVKPLKVMIQVY